MTTITSGHKTDVGRVRKMNQDSMAALEAAALEDHADGLFIVADGMGGHAGGEIASRLTVETVPAVVREVLAECGSLPPAEALTEALREGILAANETVWKQARANPDTRGMGTTCVAALVKGPLAVIGNVGDSRIYMLHEGEMVQLTHDHSLVQEYVRHGDLSAEEARRSRFRNVITRAIGISSTVEPDVEVVTLAEGDTLLLCSDGLTNMVREPVIARLLAETANPQDACESLVQAALENGGEDNITAVVVRYGRFTPRALETPAQGPELEDDLEDEDDFFPAIPATPRKLSGANRAAKRTLSALLFLLLGIASGYVLHEFYVFRLAWPWMVARKPARSVAPPVRPALDFGTLAYSRPVVLLNKPVRGAPLVCDASGAVYVVAETGRILHVTPDGMWSGDFAQSVAPTRGRAETHWASDAQGYLYVSSKADRAIYKYDRRGTRVGVIGQGALKGPEAIAVDGSGNVYVVDANRLKLFRATPGSAPGPAPGNRAGDTLSVEDHHAAR